jgi:hypothetical protein
LVMAAAASLQESHQQLTDHLQDLGGSAADPAAAMQLQQLLNSEVKTWLEPLAQQQPLRKLSEQHVLQHVGLQYLKRCGAIVRDFLAAAPGFKRFGSFEAKLQEHLSTAVAAAAPKLMEAIKGELADGGTQVAPAKLQQVLQQLLLPSNSFRLPDSLKVDLDAEFEFRYLIEIEFEKLGCLEVVYGRLKELQKQLLQLQEEALLGLQMMYAEQLDMFDVGRNADAAAALQALQAAAGAQPAAAAAAQPAAVAAAAQPAAAAAAAAQPAAAAAAVPAVPNNGGSSSCSTTWPPWPAADSPAAPAELVAVARQFCQVINSGSSFAAKSERTCSLLLFGTSRASEKEQKDRLLHR